MNGISFGAGKRVIVNLFGVSADKKLELLHVPHDVSTKLQEANIPTHVSIIPEVKLDAPASGTFPKSAARAVFLLYEENKKIPHTIATIASLFEQTGNFVAKVLPPKKGSTDTTINAIAKSHLDMKA